MWFMTTGYWHSSAPTRLHTYVIIISTIGTTLVVICQTNISTRLLDSLCNLGSSGLLHIPKSSQAYMFQFVNNAPLILCQLSLSRLDQDAVLVWIANSLHIIAWLKWYQILVCSTFVLATLCKCLMDLFYTLSLSMMWINV